MAARRTCPLAPARVTIASPVRGASAGRRLRASVVGARANVAKTSRSRARARGAFLRGLTPLSRVAIISGHKSGGGGGQRLGRGEAGQGGESERSEGQRGGTRGGKGCHGVDDA
ncbi:hypothetical protein OAO87_04265 [bacterium]|nr:hypothetical protein [bacterium]